MRHIDQGLLGIDLDDLVHIDSYATQKDRSYRRWDVMRARFQLSAAVSCIVIGILLLTTQLGEALLQLGVPVSIGLTAWGLLAAGVLLIRRCVQRGLSQSRYWSSVCPGCADCELTRVRRRPVQRLLAIGLALPIRNYVCAGCQWRGFRIDRARL